MPLPLLALALAAGAVRMGVGAYQNRKETRRKRGLVQQAYRNSADRLATRQEGVRQNTMESLNARGLLQGGDEQIDPSTERNSTDAAVTRPNEGPGTPAVRMPRTLAGQTRADTERELGLEWKDLDFDRRQSESDLKAAGQQQTVNDIAAGIQTGATVFGAGKMMGARGGGGAEYGTSSYPGGMFGKPRQLSPIASAMSSVDDPANWFGGIHGLDPLNAPGSSWNRGGGTSGTRLGAGQTNAEFTV